MIRVAALLVAASVSAVALPAAADGIPREKRPTVTRTIEDNRAVGTGTVIEEKIAVEQKPAPVVAAPSPPPPPMTPVYVWMPGRWTWNSPMTTHVWVPAMYILPPSSAEQQSLAQWRLGKWIGIGRED
jgi:hypothetical protein